MASVLKVDATISTLRSWVKRGYFLNKVCAKGVTLFGPHVHDNIHSYWNPNRWILWCLFELTGWITRTTYWLAIDWACALLGVFLWCRRRAIRRQVCPVSTNEKWHTCVCMCVCSLNQVNWVNEKCIPQWDLIRVLITSSPYEDVYAPHQWYHWKWNKGILSAAISFYPDYFG